MLSSRVPLRAAMVVAVMPLLAGALVAGSARADNPSAADLQARLVESRQQLNALYARAAAANERVNGATYRLAQAETALKQQRAVRQRASHAFEEQRKVVAAMTVEQQLNGSTSQAMMSLLDGDDPTAILEEATGLKAVDEAMTAELDRLDAGKTVLDSASHAVEAVVEEQRQALADRKDARRQITESIKQAEALQSSMEAERDGILEQLARAQGVSLEEVKRQQDEIDDRIDESGPTTPGGPQPTTPTPHPTTNPTTPPSTSTPTTPPPTVPDPGPASSSAVEKAIAYAKAQLGEKYAWGGAGPSSWDCSGLTMRAWQAAGVNLPHYAPTQYSQTKKVSVSKIKRGDLLFWSDGSVASIYHVALYLGDGQMIHAPRPGRTVEIVPLSYWIQPDMASRPG